jgi:anti-sigma factor RsiW
MTHLTRADLTRWLDEGRADERERVLSHLASCDACRTALAEMVRMQVPAVESTRFAARDFVARGHAAYPGTIGGAARWKWPAVAVSGLAAALLLAVLSISPLLRTTREPATIPAETRGGDVRLIEPSGGTRVPFEFRWSSPVAASSYRVSVFDAGHRVIYTASSRSERLPAPADLRARLVAGADYTWSVEALDAGDSRIVGSSPQRFTIAR